ncbi:MAG: hypothetical protein AAF533_15015 [Acidobacteriota bacterium]
MTTRPAVFLVFFLLLGLVPSLSRAGFDTACYDPNTGECEEGVPEEDCDGIFGEPGNCELGACCQMEPPYECDIRPGFVCDGADELFTSGADCGFNPCLPTGACCAGDRCLGVMTVSACVDRGFGGVWAGPDTTCETIDCTIQGACCAVDGSFCFEIQPFGCITGPVVEYRGDGTFCDDECPQVLGACCLPEDDCSEEVTELECSFEDDGVWLEGADCEACSGARPIPLPPWAKGLLAMALMVGGVLVLAWNGRAAG